MLSILIVAIGAAVLKYAVPVRAEGEAVLAPINYVRGTFGWGGVVGGFIFGLGAMFAGGCGSGTLWRVGEGQVKLMMVVPFFAITSSIMTAWFRDNDFEADGLLGSFVYLPDVMGYGGTLLLIAAFAVQHALQFNLGWQQFCQDGERQCLQFECRLAAGLRRGALQAEAACLAGPAGLGQACLCGAYLACHGVEHDGWED